LKKANAMTAAASPPTPSSPAAEAHQRAHQLELLRPHEIRAALAARSVVYLPLGTIEWHAEHLPVGLDALTAHGVCLAAAERAGGLVYPPLHFGTGGGHGDYPWTVMLADEAAIVALLELALRRLQQFGVHCAVLFTGHFADEQIAMIRHIAQRWNDGGHTMTVLARSMNEISPTPIAPDHAGIFETTLLHALAPERVDLGQLPPKPPRTGDIEEDGWGPQRHVTGHPLWGVVGPDPRNFDPAQGPVLLAAAVAWLVAQVAQAHRAAA
jgi:creatinine amidohydrolase